MDSNKQRRSIDGFHANRHPNRQPIFKDSSLNLKADQHHPKPPVKKIEPVKMAPINANFQQKQPSLIGMNISNSKSSILSSHERGKKAKTKKSWSRKRKVLTTVLAIAVVFIGMLGWFGSRLIGSIDKVFHGNIFSDAQALFSQTNLKETDGRVNILVAGDSADDPGHAGADLTDSIMVLSIDPQNHTGFMFSIPRDLWVYIPGLGTYQKINATNDVTNFSQSGYPNGGMGQLEEIVQTDLGIPVDYYALVNYTAFKDAVDAVGGITITVNSPDPRGLYDSFTTLKLPNGQDNLDGQVALNLARARGDDVAGDISYGFPSSDFTRTMYQREMVVAILKKATSLGVLSNPLKVTSLFSSISNNVRTDFSLRDALNIGGVVKGMNFSALGSYTYSSSLTGSTTPLITGYTDSASGQEGLIPSEGLGNYGALRAYYQQLVSNNPVTKENATVEILNGTNVTGLAKQAETTLQSKGADSIAIADALKNYPQTLIVDNSNGKDPSTKALLQKIFPGSTTTSGSGSPEAKEAANYSDKFIVILGQNYATSVASTTSSTTGSATN